MMHPCVCPQSLRRDEKGFVRTENIYMRNIIANKKPGLLIRLTSFTVKAQTLLRPWELGGDENGFVRTEIIDTRNIIANKKPGLLIRLKSFSAKAA